jgi:general secretion pathway protein K
MQKINFQKSLAHQRGAVLVVALFFVALTVTLSYFMMSELEKDTRRTGLLLRNIQADLYAQGSIAWAKQQLHDDIINQKTSKPVDLLPLKSPDNEVGGYHISSIIEDAQSRVNVNGLLDLKTQSTFKRLLKIVAPQINEEQSQQIVQAVVDWITPGQKQNEYSKYYLSLSTPYRAAHRNMVSSSELQLVKGMSPSLFTALKPYVIALPETSLINIQTAAPAVIAALGENMTMETGNVIAHLRAQSPITSVADFSALEVAKNHDVPTDQLTTISNYFLLETKVRIEKQQLVLYTLLERDNTHGKGDVDVVCQSKTICP